MYNAKQPFVSAPIRNLDCVMVRAPLLTPQGGTLLHALANSFISTTLCDDLARAAEAKEGKKVQCQATQNRKTETATKFQA